MSDERTDLALKRLATSAVPVDPPERVAARRARLLPALTAFADVEMTRTPRRRWRIVAAVAAAAVMVVASFAVFRDGPRVPTLEAREGTVRVSHEGVSRDVAGDVPWPLAAADLLETLDGTAAVRLVSGAVVDLGARSRIELATVERSSRALNEQVRLSSGHVAVRVPKLPPGSKLTIGTPDASVVVHGTAFTVEVTKTPSGSSTTAVDVSEGRVSVESAGRQLFLGPGSHWSSAPVEIAPAPAISPTSPAASGAAAGSPSPTAAPARRSTLRVENELFRAAMAARRDGDLEKAISLTDQLLRTYPDTPLGSEARALASEARQKLGSASTP